MILKLLLLNLKYSSKFCTPMPSAVLTYLVGSMYSEKKVVDSVASVIVTSTLMSIITVPIVVYYSLKSVSYTHLTLPTKA